jgi:hypothetical protein
VYVLLPLQSVSVAASAATLHSVNIVTVNMGTQHVFLLCCAACQCQNGFMAILCHQKNKTLLSEFTKTRIILIDFHNSVQYKVSQKSVQCVVELIHVDRQRDRWT